MFVKVSFTFYYRYRSGSNSTRRS